MLKNMMDSCKARFIKNIPDPDREVTFKEVTKQPLKGAFLEMLVDMDYNHMFKGSEFRQRLLGQGTIIGSYILSSVPHEFLHGVANELTGGTSKNIIINKLYGGDIFSHLSTQISSEVLPFYQGGKMAIENYGSAAGLMATFAAPYAMTPIGLYLLAEGKERKSLPMTMTGAGIVLHHAGAIIGDAYASTKYMMFNTAQKIAETFNYQLPEMNDNIPDYALCAASALIGYMAVSLSYRTFNAGAHSLKNMSFKQRTPVKVPIDN